VSKQKSPNTTEENEKLEKGHLLKCMNGIIFRQIRNMQLSQFWSQN